MESGRRPVPPSPPPHPPSPIAIQPGGARPWNCECHRFLYTAAVSFVRSLLLLLLLSLNFHFFSGFFFLSSLFFEFYFLTSFSCYAGGREGDWRGLVGGRRQKHRELKLGSSGHGCCVPFVCCVRCDANHLRY